MYYKKKKKVLELQATCQTSAAHAGMPLFQLLLHCLSPSQRRLKAFRDRNLVFLVYFFLARGSSTVCGSTEWVILSVLYLQAFHL